VLACVPLWLISDTFPELGGAFPKAVLATIAILAMLLVARSFLSGASGKAAGEGRQDGHALLHPLAVAAVATAGVAAMPVIGFFPAMAGMCVVLFFLLAGRTKVLYVATVTIALAFIYAVFVLVLGVPLEASRILGQ